MLTTVLVLLYWETSGCRNLVVFGEVPCPGNVNLTSVRILVYWRHPFVWSVSSSFPRSKGTGQKRSGVVVHTLLHLSPSHWLITSTGRYTFFGSPHPFFTKKRDFCNLLVPLFFIYIYVKFESFTERFSVF